MDQEKNLLKNELGGLEKKEEIEKFIEDAELLGHEDIVELAKQKLQEISAKADSIEKTSDSQISQAENMGGNKEEITKRTKEVDQKIEEVKVETTKKIEEVQNNNNNNTAELSAEASKYDLEKKNSESPERKKLEQEKSSFINLEEINNTKMTYALIKNDMIAYHEAHKKRFENNIKKQEIELKEYYEKIRQGEEPNQKLEEYLKEEINSKKEILPELNTMTNDKIKKDMDFHRETYKGKLKNIGDLIGLYKKKKGESVHPTYDIYELRNIALACLEDGDVSTAQDLFGYTEARAGSDKREAMNDEVKKELDAVLNKMTPENKNSFIKNIEFHKEMEQQEYNRV